MNFNHPEPAPRDDRRFRLLAHVLSSGLCLFGTDACAQAIHRMGDITPQPGRTVRLNLIGSAPVEFASYYDLYPIEASSNLRDWTPLATLLRTNSGGAPLTLLDGDEPGYSHRFYRTPTNHLITPLPKPTGPYSVGTITRPLTDGTRPNRMPFTMQIWYPVLAQAGVLPARYLDQRIAGEWAAIGLSGGPSNLWQTARAHALGGVPVATNQTSYPVVMYSHGQGSIRTDNTLNAENLASHGFIVVVVEHFFAVVQVLPDGRIINGFRPEPNNVNLADRIRDVQFGLDELARMNAGDPQFGGRFDLDHLGIFGWSFGGGVTVEMCASDSRCKAGASLDGGIFTYLLGLGFDKPFMVMVGDDNNVLLLPHRINFRALFDKFTQPGAYFLNVQGATHSEFGEPPWFASPTDQFKLRRALAIRDYLLAFFNKHLKGQDNHLLDGPSAAYPEVSSFLRSALTITRQPLSQNIRRGQAATLSVVATSPLPIGYQWLSNGVPLVPATNATLIFSAAEPEQSGNYTVTLTDATTSLTSQTAVLNIGDPPVITTQPQSQTVPAGSDVTFSVIVSGTLPISYRWRKSSATLTNMMLNATISLFTIPNVQTNQAGNYTVAITNLFGAAPLSSTAILTVTGP